MKNIHHGGIVVYAVVAATLALVTLLVTPKPVETAQLMSVLTFFG
ncbi:hypothetical protein V6C27_02695 [Peptococcaceae bacterium 1198_IL3148]